jgi:hypothetical protein
VADGLRRLDGVASVEVDLQQNLCHVTPAPDRLPDLAGLPAAVRAAGFRPGRMWIEARGVVTATVGGGQRFTIEGTDVALAFDGAQHGPGTVVGRVEFGAATTLHAEPAPR